MTEFENDAYPVLLAGGSGTRMWPVSREFFPKQLVNFIGEDSLVQSTIKRMSPVLDKNRVRIVCGREHYHEIARHMQDIGVSPENKIICEPCGRNTGPAILLAVLTILDVQPDAVLCIFPADHVIRDIAMFQARLREAIRLAADGHIVTFGIKPGYPETGYGYIEGAPGEEEGARSIRQFVEKPDRQTAERYIEAGNFYWNSGMFAFRASVMRDEFKQHQPRLFEQLCRLPRDNTIDRAAYEKLPSISFDYAVMEKTGRGVVLPSDFGWSDIGSWKSLYDFLPKNGEQNVIDGDVIAKDTQGSFIMGRDRLIATNHLRNLVIVDTPDSVFVSDIDNSRNVKSIVMELKEKGRREYQNHRTVYHPWGKVTVLAQREDHLVSRLEIYPQSELEDDPEGFRLSSLTVVEGAVEIRDQEGVKSLARGETTIVDARRRTVAFKNLSGRPAVLIVVRVTPPA